MRPAFESFERAFLTKVGSALTLSAIIAEGIFSPWRKPRAAMMCAATVNWTLVADSKSPGAHVMCTSTIGIQVFLTGPPATCLHYTQQDYRIAERVGVARRYGIGIRTPWCEMVGNDSEILAASALETRFETRLSVSQVIASRRRSRIAVPGSRQSCRMAGSLGSPVRLVGSTAVVATPRPMLDTAALKLATH
jgi:hypothetical protein